MKGSFEQDGFRLTAHGNHYLAVLGARTARVELLGAAQGRLDLLIDGRRVTAFVSSDQGKHWVSVDGQTFLLIQSSEADPGRKRRRSGAGRAAGAELAAPMPGLIRGVNIRAGDAIAQGQTLLVMEAMKMEIRIQAPRAGRVKTVFVEPGQTVEREQVLIELEAI